MKSPIPSHAERVYIDGVIAWLWSTSLGWNLLSWPYQVDLENLRRGEEDWHTVDWFNSCPRKGDFEGGLARNHRGHLEKSEFFEIASKIVRALREGNKAPEPPPRT